MTAYPEQWSDLEVSLSHDWLTGMRGGERVLEILGNGMPKAKISTLIYNPDAIADTIKSHAIRSSWINRLPNVNRYYRYLLPLFPAAIRSLPPASGSLLISTSHCVAKGHRKREGVRHLCYCFTPMRYAWLFHEEYFGGNALKGALAAPVLASLRHWDRRASDGVDRFVAISEHVRRRIKAFYDRDADVVYPPVDTDTFTPGDAPRERFDLIVSALVPYKRVDLAVQAYSRLGHPLKIVGIGSDLDRLRKSAAANVEFLEWRSDADILGLYRSARCLVFPGEEDFGIVPLEAQACGCPVVAYGKGGALETVQEGLSGIFFPEQTTDALIAAVRQCADTSWDAAAIRRHAEAFGTQNFVRGIAESIDKCLA